MEYLKTFDQSLAAMGLLVPGLVILFVRSQFVTDRRPVFSSVSLLNYLMVSLVYYAIVSPCFNQLLRQIEQGSNSALVWFGLIFGGPALLGLALGINVQKNILLR